MILINMVLILVKESKTQLLNTTQALITKRLAQL